MQGRGKKWGHQDQSGSYLSHFEMFYLAWENAGLLNLLEYKECSPMYSPQHTAGIN